jgi:hypothetical protein
MAAYKMAAVKVTPPNDFPLGLIRSHIVVIHLILMLGTEGAPKGGKGPMPHPIFLLVYSIDLLSDLCVVSRNFANMSFRCGEKWILWRLDIFSSCCSPNSFSMVKTKTV